MYHISFLWNQRGDRIGGWTENFWTPAVTIPAARIRAQALFVKLVPVHGVETSCPAYRLTYVPDIPVPGGSRLSAVYQTGYTATSTLTGTADTSADYVSVAYQLNLSAGGPDSPPSRGPINRTQWLRGILDSAIVEGGRAIFGGANATVVQQLMLHLQGSTNEITMRVVNPAIGPAPITTGFPATGRLTVVNHGVPAGQTRLVRVSGVDSPTQFNGLHWVTRIDDTTVEIVGWATLGAVPFLGKGSWLKRQEFQSQVITEARVVRASSHYTGRPTGQLGGRRRRKVS